MKMATTAISTVALAALAVTGCATGRPGPAPTITHTVTKRAPVATITPAPTVTITNTASPPSGQPSSPPASPGAGQVIVRFSGSGTQSTASFATPASWALAWAYWGCPNGKSNFVVTEYNADGSIDPNGVSVNELGTGRGPVATHAYGDAGRHYLSVTTEGCHWSLVPVTVLAVGRSGPAALARADHSIATRFGFFTIQGVAAA